MGTVYAQIEGGTDTNKFFENLDLEDEGNAHT
jgi:hypothetical protein